MASDDMDALKYMYAYSCGGEFERGYVNAHMEHLGLYEKIKEAFAGKEPAGVRVYESIKKIAEEEHKDLDSLLRGNAIYAIWVDEQREQEQEQE